MLHVDLERVVALFAVIDPKGKEEIKGVYFNGSVFIACSTVNYVEFKPVEETPVFHNGWFPLSSIDHLKALLKAHKGLTVLPHSLIAPYYMDAPSYPNIQSIVHGMQARPTTQTVTVDLKQLVALHRSLTLGLKNAKKDHITLEFKGDHQPVSVVSFEGNKGMIMPIREGA